MTAALQPDTRTETPMYTLADLSRAKARVKRLTDSLERGMALLAPMEVALLAQHGGKLPDPLPPGEYAEKLVLWRELLARYQEAEKTANRIKNLLRSQAKGAA